MKQPADWECVRSETLADLRLFRARFDWMKNPRNGAVQQMIVLDSPDAANVVALTTEQQLLFVQQYRFGTSKSLLELPGGLVNTDEPREAAAQRELREETGYTGGQWHYLGSIPSNPVFMTNHIHHYLAEGVSLTDPLQLDEGEDLIVVAFPIEEVFQSWRAGAFQHPHTVNALLLFFAHRGLI